MGDLPHICFNQFSENLIPQPEEGWSSKVKAKLIMYLKRCVLFQHLTTDNLFKVIDTMRYLRFEQGDTVLKEGDPGNELFVVDEGTS